MASFPHLIRVLHHLSATFFFFFERHAQQQQQKCMFRLFICCAVCAPQWRLIDDRKPDETATNFYCGAADGVEEVAGRILSVSCRATGDSAGPLPAERNRIIATDGG